MPICPWPHLIVFVFGGGAAVLTISLFGTVAVNGKFGDDNKFRKYNYGMDKKMGQLAVINVSCAMICGVFVCLAIGFNIKHLPGCAQLVMWVLAYLMFLGTAISQMMSLSYSRFGDSIVPGFYNYYSNEDFKSYVDKNYNGLVNGPDGSVAEFTWGPETGFVNLSGEIIPIVYPIHLPMTQFYVSFVHNYKTYSVPSCVIDWNSSVFMGADPCNFQITETQCIGDWTGGHFRNYWCYEFRQNRSHRQATENKTLAEKQKYYAKIQRQSISLDSYSAFYQLNATFLGLNICGIVIVSIALILINIVNPFNKKGKPYQKIQASASGSGSDSGKSSSNKKAKTTSVQESSTDESY
ncbi:hypothetical protein TRFO_04107 [Tritrichomonas foetus]|uniref:Uncharacterized protein n=1 Tax=Tritrichomonas foetus TaxID=1144522 RepID=A0A1J4KLE7_9EUKA|nr:hypothetical protein TRFO_04107 [Tritrichomonas foetus]|eukprot:OHT10620.1 hypothetical protein TRFO_04107 [Tritrichomonas foetus]